MKKVLIICGLILAMLGGETALYAMREGAVNQNMTGNRYGIRRDATCEKYIVEIVASDQDCGQYQRVIEPEALLEYNITEYITDKNHIFNNHLFILRGKSFPFFWNDQITVTHGCIIHSSEPRLSFFAAMGCGIVGIAIVAIRAVKYYRKKQREKKPDFYQLLAMETMGK